MTAMRLEDADRLRTLLDTGIAIGSELSLDAVLERIVDAAAALTGARYAALGVIDPSGAGLERFVFTGLEQSEADAIGDLPRGRGILGVLIEDARPLRLRDLGDDPRSVGFPPNHPEMRTFLGVPILLRDVAYGNLYLTEKEGGEDFSHDDQELVTLLASQAAVAIENARLYEAATTWSRQLESLNEIGNALVGELDLPRLLDLIARRLHELIDARVVTILLPSGSELRIAAAVGDDAEQLVGRILPRAEALAATTGLTVPLLAREQEIGVIVAHDKLGTDSPFTGDDLRLAEQFAARAAVAVDLSLRVARDSLRRVVAGQELERRRLARELHDETGQALTSILLGLKAVEEAQSDDELRAAGAELRELIVATLQDVRRLAVQLRPTALDDFGLVAAVERLARTISDATGIAVDVESRLGPERLPEVVETTLYRIVQEALTNVVKHAQARSVTVLLVRRDGMMTAMIEDDGRGFDPDELRDEGLGFLGMRERVALLDGRLTIESSPGAGTTLVAEVRDQ
jgi:signal transduction histidine kinase